jgi:hypothetical protein
MWIMYCPVIHRNLQISVSSPPSPIRAWSGDGIHCDLVLSHLLGERACPVCECMTYRRPDWANITRMGIWWKCLMRSHACEDRSSGSDDNMCGRRGRGVVVDVFTEVKTRERLDLGHNWVAGGEDADNTHIGGRDTFSFGSTIRSRRGHFRSNSATKGAPLKSHGLEDGNPELEPPPSNSHLTMLLVPVRMISLYANEIDVFEV